MTVDELRRRLLVMDGDAQVGFVFDGAIRGSVNVVWAARSGEVALSDWDSAVYDTNDRPADAPTSEEERYWRTPADPEEAELE